MTDRELMQMALDALEKSRVFVTTREKAKHPEGTEWYDERIEALRARLAQPEPEPSEEVLRRMVEAYTKYQSPVDKGYSQQEEGMHLALIAGGYTAPPQREWQTLTENEIKHLWYEACQTNLELTSQLIVHLARNIEAKLKEKNG